MATHANIQNIPFARKTKHKHGITIEQMKQIFTYNHLSIDHLKQTETNLYSVLLRQENIQVPFDLWPYFLFGLFVRLPGKGDIRIKTADDVHRLTQLCVGQPCYVIGFLDETGAYQDHRHAHKGLPDYRPVQNTPRNNDRLTYDPATDTVTGMNIVSGKRKREKSVTAKRAELSEKNYRAFLRNEA